VTDTALGKVYRVDNSPEGGIEEIASDPLLQAPDFGANGIVKVGPELLIVGNYGSSTLVRVDIKNKTVVNIELDQPIGNPDGLLFLNDERVVVVNGTKLFVLANRGGWRSAQVVEVVDVNQTGTGETATTAAVGSNDCEIFVTYVRFGELFGNSTNARPSLIGKVNLACAPAPGGGNNVSNAGRAMTSMPTIIVAALAAVMVAF
jgi:hypothetical protein